MAEPLQAEMPILMEILGGFERSAVVLGAAQLELFSPLGNGPATAAEVAAQTGLPVRGVESQGMLLAASDGERVIVLSPEKPVAPGAKVR